MTSQIDHQDGAIAKGERGTALTNAVRRFPAGFTWGVATSSFQIEGGRAGRGESIWDVFATRPGAIRDGSNGDTACGHAEMAATDVGLMADLGLGSYRFSISWPRVIPDGTGDVAPEGLGFYDRLVDHLLAAGIEPYVTLYHWDLPQALEDAGGWQERATAYHFAEYADVVARQLGDRVTRWSTLNEPYCSAQLGYVKGEMAPGIASVQAGFAAAHHLLLGHGLAVERLRDRLPRADVGVVLNFNPMYPASESPADVAATAVEHALFNRWFVEPIAGRGYPVDATGDERWTMEQLRDGDLDVIATPIDHLGINYYSRSFVREDREPTPARGPATAMGWEIYPAGLGEIVRWLHDEFDFPRYRITENGAAMDDQPDATGFVDDQDRIEYLRLHLEEVHRLIDEGIPLDGYYAWSLLDNFEWAWGYTQRFGLVRVDYDTLVRTPKASAHWYGEVATANAL